MPPSSDNPTAQEQLEVLITDFGAGLPAKLGDISSLFEEMARGGWTSSRLDSAYKLVHKLAGSSGLLGYHMVHIAAKTLENTLHDTIREGKVGPSQVETITYQLKMLLQAVADDNPSPPKFENQVGAEKSEREKRSRRTIYLVEDDLPQAREISLQLGYFGYTVRCFEHPSELKDAIQAQVPTAIVMDVVFPDSLTAGPDMIAELRPLLTDSMPVVFISESENLECRLQAVRAGGEAFFSKPLEISPLIDTLDRLTSPEPPPRYRVLVVEDSRTQAMIVANYLEEVNIETLIENNPLHILHSLTDFNPDLVLLDMYMPQCTGIELARVIRQMEKFVGLPIVYLSAETDKDKQLEAMREGGDDFLSKPIKAEHLVKSVISRVERYHKLQMLMNRDGLTGLLNHTNTKERLSQEILRAARQKGQFSFVMIDLDKFKLVNDNYGHATGDRVLKSLARMLYQRLRVSDIIGRYGGEEFAVILPDTLGSAAVKLMDDLREGFANIHHHVEKDSFIVTFSCGVASYPRFSTPASISDAADRALYMAKHNGRNQVVFADEADRSTWLMPCSLDNPPYE